ncbi:MAG: ion transporter [Arenicellales bacterium]|jgi:voltage-gated sodium channel
MQSAHASWRQQLAAFVDSPGIEKFIIGLILINAVTLGMETSDAIMSRYGTIIRTIDGLIISVFVIEIGLRITAHGRAFFKDPWSVFDFTVVAIALVPASSQFSVLRALRVLRVLRLLTMVPQMRRVVGALLSAIPGLSTIIMVLLLIFYVFAVIATNLFGDQYADWFGSIGSSMYTLFQVMTLESWSMGIVRPLMQTHPYAWAFFVPFILIATFTILNLFIAIIVNAMQTQAELEASKTIASVETATGELEHELHAGLERLEQELAAMRRLMEKSAGRN